MLNNAHPFRSSDPEINSEGCAILRAVFRERKQPGHLQVTTLGRRGLEIGLEWNGVDKRMGTLGTLGSRTRNFRLTSSAKVECELRIAHVWRCPTLC